jgi:hypothetical protein
MGNLKSRIKKAQDALEKSAPAKKVKLFFSEKKLDVLSEEEIRFIEQNPDYDGEVLTICWHDPNAIGYGED